MINKFNLVRSLAIGFAVSAIALVVTLDVNSQTRDPFAKPGWARTKDPKAGGPGKVSGPAVNMGLPAIEARIEYYKRLRESAAMSGNPIPKVTSVLALNEMAVTGIFKTPRGYAAMVEATPIRLSYTIYPGEKFFDGQLVAVEENRLVFRKVTKMSNGKFVSSVENKPLREYSQKEVVQGTAPVENSAGSEPPPVPQPVTPTVDGKVAATDLVSPLDEMDKQGSDKPASDKPTKKTVRVARKNK